MKWLFDEVKENNGIEHKIYGKFYENPAIDTLKFDKVTKAEKEEYKKFESLYSRRWKQIDPLGIQILKNDKEHGYISRLYLSPISNRSQYRFLRDIVPEVKVIHSFDDVSGTAIGVSFALAGKFLKGFIPINLPVILFIKAISFDFAPTSFAVRHWLGERPRLDGISYFRIPATIALPSSILLSGLPFAVNSVSSVYKNVERITNRIEISEFFPSYFTDPKGSILRYFSFDPLSLVRINKSIQKKELVDKIPADLRVFVDFKYGYMLRRKFWQELVKNRTFDSWSSYQKNNRLLAYLGMQKESFNSKKNVEIKNYRISSLVDENYKRLYSSLPDYPEVKMKSGYSSFTYSRYSPSASKCFKNLPDFFLRMTRLDFYTNIEENGIYIETHYRTQYNEREKIINSKKGGVITPENNSKKQQQLDFDE
jgi:hypothetical protein